MITHMRLCALALLVVLLMAAVPDGAGARLAAGADKRADSAPAPEEASKLEKPPKSDGASKPEKPPKADKAAKHDKAGETDADADEGSGAVSPTSEAAPVSGEAPTSDAVVAAAPASTSLAPSTPTEKQPPLPRPKAAKARATKSPTGKLPTAKPRKPDRASTPPVRTVLISNRNSDPPVMAAAGGRSRSFIVVSLGGRVDSQPPPARRSRLSSLPTPVALVGPDERRQPATPSFRTALILTLFGLLAITEALLLRSLIRRPDVSTPPIPTLAQLAAAGAATRPPRPWQMPIAANHDVPIGDALGKVTADL
jgi:hypothetical protein